MKRIIIFASGSGSNAEKIIQYFQSTKTAVVTYVLSNNEYAKVFKKCKKLKINGLSFNKKMFLSSDEVLNFLKKEADYIVLAGFLWKIPLKILIAFPNKIINIHPALLPKFGGKGMYGMHVHCAVKEQKEIESGITIHFVNKNYDEGAIIFQKKISISTNDTPKTIAKKVLKLEHIFFPKIIEQVILGKND